MISGAGGDVIALEVVTLFPEVVICAIIHEPPLALLAPNSEKWVQFFQTCRQRAYKLGGSSVSAMQFLLGIEVPVIKMIIAQIKVGKYLKNEPSELEVKSIPQKVSTDYLIKQELVPITTYNPNIEALREDKDKIIVACGTYAQSRNTWLYKTAKHLSEKINCEFVVFSGRHASFMDDIEN